MCGLWGVFPNNTKGFFPTDVSAIEQSMVLTSLRGSHSTGIAMIADGKLKPRVIKSLGGPAYLINSDAWEKISDFAVQKAKVAFGHGRYATKGAITAKNAHPFTVDHITLVHNGTIHYGLKDELVEVESDVDSHALCGAIAKKGLVPALSGIFGAYALIVHDAKEGCIYIVRNDERPLHRLVLSDKHIILSEADACRYLAGRLNATNPKVEVFPKHLIFKYDIATAEWSSDDSLVKEMQKKYIPTSPTQIDWKAPHGSGGNNKWDYPSRKNGVTESTFYLDLEMLCTKIEDVEGTRQYRYVFNDDNGYEYGALSAYKMKEREGTIAKVKKFVKMVDHKTGEITRFIKFREIVWEDDAKKPDSPKTGAANDDVQVETKNTIIMTYNNIAMKKSKWLDLIKKEDCALCQGPILEDEAENTIVTNSTTLICGDCIKDGKHYQFGFGQ